MRYRWLVKDYCSSVAQSSLTLWILWTAAHQAYLSFTISWRLLRFMSIELVMPSNCLILCCPLLLLPSIFPSIRVFSNESALLIRWPKFWSFSFNISPSKEHPGLTFFFFFFFNEISLIHFIQGKTIHELYVCGGVYLAPKAVEHSSQGNLGKSEFLECCRRQQKLHMIG